MRLPSAVKQQSAGNMFGPLLGGVITRPSAGLTTRPGVSGLGGFRLDNNYFDTTSGVENVAVWSNGGNLFGTRCVGIEHARGIGGAINSHGCRGVARQRRGVRARTLFVPGIAATREQDTGHEYCKSASYHCFFSLVLEIPTFWRVG